MERRKFLHQMTSVAAAGQMSAMAQATRARVGVIGAGGRGRFLTGEFKEIGAEMAAVCDVYQPNLQLGLAAANTGAKAYSDYRALLDDKSLQAVIVATPDHWHAQMVIDAVQAGKDVYVEKPLAHTIEEGYRMMEAVRQTKRIVQVGTQRRSAPLFLEARKLFLEADKGPVRLVNSWWYNNQADINRRSFTGPIDWKQWLGKAPEKAEEARRFFNWYYYWDYSGGLMVGQAAHMLDLIQWFMEAEAPVAVTTSGGRVNLEGVEVPATTTICLEYAKNFMAVFTVGYEAMRYHSSLDQLAQFHGSKARFDMGREGYALYAEDPKATQLKPATEKLLPGSFGSITRAHIRNFLECTVTRQQPTAPVETAQHTNIALCMAMESLRKGRRVRFDAATRKMSSEG